TKADEIIGSAKKLKEEIIRDAHKKAEEERKRNETEIQLAARQFISHLKQQITELISTVVIDSRVEEAFNDTDFIKKLIITVTGNWNAEKEDQPELKVMLPPRLQKGLMTFIQEEAGLTMNKGIDFMVDEELKTGFRIGPKDGNYLISFTANDFTNYFKQYVKEDIKKLLFDTTEKK
ncbi:MAG TPA: hypothetical protein VEP89_15585, partial [Draconibacterium sp.]|nr:hypothetical protein [Draconibacterium sp.]